jgi:hypothetical protein
MKTKIAAALLATAAMVTAACEQHKWSETSQLFKSHGDHAEAHGEHAEHGAAEKAKGHEAAKHE